MGYAIGQHGYQIQKFKKAGRLKYLKQEPDKEIKAYKAIAKQDGT